MAAKVAYDHLETICEKFPDPREDLEPFIQTAMTTLGSKMLVLFTSYTIHPSRPTTPPCTFFFVSELTAVTGRWLK